VRLWKWLTCNPGISLRNVVWQAALGTSILLASISVRAQTPITISVQPNIYWGFPVYLATEKGWWAEVGLAPKVVTYAAGLPQVSALADDAWDVGGTGSVPAMIGADKFQLDIIGVTNDESATNALYASPGFAAKYQADRGSLRGQKIVLTTNSTVDFAAQACLALAGMLKTDTNWVTAAQKDVLASVAAKETEIAGLWAPNTYLAEAAGWKSICSGRDSRVLIPGLLVARNGFAKANPDAVAKFLAVYLRGWQWAKANPISAKALLKKFYGEGGLQISETAIAKEFALRPTFSVEEQLALMATSSPGSDSKLAFALQRMGIFLRESGIIASTRPAQKRVTDQYLKIIQSSPKLSAVAANRG
jgi:ABC-type nitrate/sulfonate/bicarbonate transport system substrate-binding protein